MLFVVFQAGGARFALEARQVLEVIPRVASRPCPGAPAYIVGLVNYGGAVMPVVDLGLRLGGQPSVPHLSTRILVTPYACGGGRQRVLGLLAEAVTETVDRDAAEFRQPSVGGAGRPWLGQLAIEGAGFLQRVVTTDLVPPELETLWAPGPEEARPA